VANLFRRPQLRGAVADITMFSPKGKLLLASVAGPTHKDRGRPPKARSEMEATGPKNDREDQLRCLPSGSLDWSINECVWE